MELVVNGLVANVGIGIVPWFSLSSPQGLLLGFFARGRIEFFDDDLWVNQKYTIDFKKKKRFPVIQIDSMCQPAIFLSRLSMERELGNIAG